MPNGTRKQHGILLGRVAAAAVLARMQNDGSNHPETLVGSGCLAGNGPGEWRRDPVSRLPVALGAKWGRVRPFVIPSGQTFRVPPPPSMRSTAYTAAFNEVKALGGDGLSTPTVRTADQTVAGIYWAYEGTPSLCAPPRLYNQIAEVIANQMGSDVVDQARMFALLNVGMADTGFTPPFPAYPSGHAGFGGVLFQTLRNVHGRDDIAFTFVSDELNGVTVDNEGVVRPLTPRTFTSLSQAEEENGQSRVYLGIHWVFDKTAGIQQGRNVANYVHRNAFRKLR